MDCSPPGFSVNRILQARILQWVAISFSNLLPKLCLNDLQWLKHIQQNFFFLKYNKTPWEIPPEKNQSYVKRGREEYKLESVVEEGFLLSGLGYNQGLPEEVLPEMKEK